MKPSNRRAIIVGIFIFLGLAIFIVAVLTLGSQHKTFEKAISIKAIFDNVNGLQKGNNIWYSGVKVGTIKKVVLAANSLVEVTMNIEKSSSKFIHKNATAKISSDGLIGNRIVVIYGGTPEYPAVQEGDVLGIEKLLNTEELMKTLSKNNDNLLEITNGLKIVSQRMADGKGSIGKLLTDESLANNLNATIVILKRSSSNLERFSTSMANYSAQLHTKGALANDLVTDTVIFNRLRATVSQLQTVSETSNNIVNDLKQASSSLNTSMHTLNSSMTNKTVPVGMLLNDQEAASNIKITLRNLQSGTKKLDDDLEAVQHNFLLRGFFRKKERKEKADSLQLKKMQ
jgi:ABC-type transport system involved in resistance to organic solvents, periplasmic component